MSDNIDPLAPYAYPGRYEGELNLAAILDSSDGADDTCYEPGEGNGSYSLYLDLERDPDLAGRIGTTRAALLHESSQGFVTATYFDSNADARAEFDRIVIEIELEEETDDTE